MDLLKQEKKKDKNEKNLLIHELVNWRQGSDDVNAYTEDEQERRKEGNCNDSLENTTRIMESIENS